jgi:hypothetical protein
MTVPAKEFDLAKLPKNIQTTESFQQLYLHDAVREGDSAVIYLSYTLGANADVVKDVSSDEQIEHLVKALRQAAEKNRQEFGNGPATTTVDAKLQEAVEQLENLANLVVKHKSRVSYTHWTNVPTQEGAFKMDKPGQHGNTGVMYRETLKSGTGPYFPAEEYGPEGGFASGALVGAVNTVQSMAVRLGGKLPPNSPLHQELLWADDPMDVDA